MQFIEFSISVFFEAKEALTPILIEEGIEGCIIKDRDDITTFNFFLNRESPWEEKWARIKNKVENLRAFGLRIHPYSFNVRKIEANWWEKLQDAYRQPRKIADGIWVVPPEFEDEQKDGSWYIKLKGGLAFGTGDHPSTKLSLELMKDHFGNLKKILDVGTGTGILAIGAIFNGAEEVLAIDNDPEAVKLAAENAELNNFDNRIRVQKNNLIAGVKEKFNGIVINILLDAIVKCLPDLPNLLAEDGLIILAGILARQIDDLKAPLEQIGFGILDIRLQGEWVGLLVGRKAQ